MIHSQSTYPVSTDDFKRVTGEFRGSSAYKDPMLFAVGRQVRTRSGTLASVRYPVVNGPAQNTGTAAILMEVLGIEPVGVQNIELTSESVGEVLRYFAPFEGDGKMHENIDVLKAAQLSLSGQSAQQNTAIASFIFDDTDPEGVADSTLKLYGISNRHFKPNTLNLKKVFTKLPNMAWIGDQPLDEEDVQRALMDAAFGGRPFAPHMVDKFPLYAHRINALKLGVRITDAHKVRLGAYLGEGTVVMPGAAFINFDAGTEGGMIEGRISSKAFVGKGSDIGGGAAILGVLSGGNDVPVSVGRNCLLEMNCSLGISIGDASIIAADTAVLASSIIRVGIEGHPFFGQSVKASLLSGINAATFRRNDRDGVLEVVRVSRNIEFAKKLADGETILNADLHTHN